MEAILSSNSASRLNSGQFRSIGAAKQNPTITGGPRSLIQIVRVFQVFGISFDGIDFDLGSVSKSGSPVTTRRNLAPILWSLIYFVLIVGLIVQFTFMGLSPVYLEFLELLQTSKPILRLLMNSVNYLFALSSIFGFVYFSRVAGRPLISHLCERTVLDQDQDNSLVRSILSRLALFVVTMIVTGVTLRCSLGLYQQDLSVKFVVWSVIIQCIHYLAFSAVLFEIAILLYIVAIYRRQIDHIWVQVNQNNLGVTQLIVIRRQVQQLYRHYQISIGLLQPSLVISLLSSSWMLVGTLCMLLIIPNLSQFRLTAFLYHLVCDSILVLLVMVFSGDQVHHQYDQLLEYIQNRVQIWTPYKMLYLQRLSICSSHYGQFRLRLFRTFTMNQTLLISLSTFILNYIVLLIQTDNTKQGPNPADFALSNQTKIRPNNFNILT